MLKVVAGDSVGGFVNGNLEVLVVSSTSVASQLQPLSNVFLWLVDSETRSSPGKSVHLLIEVSERESNSKANQKMTPNGVLCHFRYMRMEIICALRDAGSL